MDTGGSCVALQRMETAEDTLSLDLPVGTYDVYAVGGISNYDMPTQAEATKDSPLTPKSGQGHGELMTAYNSVVMAKDEENRLTLQLRRRVMQVQDITLTNIPTDVTAVSLTLSPLRSGVLLSGDYAEGTDSHTFELTKQADGSTWKSAAAEYLLEASNTVTLKVSLTRATGTTAYSYASTETLSANYKVNITGNYVDNENISLSGTILGTEWAGTVDLEFDFDSTNITSTDNGGTSTDDPTTLHGDAPAAGTMYKGCYVLRAVNSGTTTTVTLVTPTEKNKLTYTLTDGDTEASQAAIKTATDQALSEVAVSGVDGWRLPTQEEVEYVKDNVSSINEQIEALSSSSVETFLAKYGANYYHYYFTSSDGNIYVYCIVDGTITKQPASARATYKVRGFTELTFSD